MLIRWAGSSLSCQAFPSISNLFLNIFNNSRWLGEYEWLLHQAQAQDSLSKLRDLLRLWDFLIKKKKNLSRGVQQNTRSQSEINKAEKKIQACTAKYLAAHSALCILVQILGKGSSWSMEFQQLKDDHIKSILGFGWFLVWPTLRWISHNLLMVRCAIFDINDVTCNLAFFG